MTNHSNVTSKIMIITGIFIMMLMLLTPAKKVKAAGGSSFSEAEQIRFNTSYLTSTTEDMPRQYYKFKTASSKAKYTIKIDNLTGDYRFFYSLYDKDLKKVDSVEHVEFDLTKNYSKLKSNSIYYILFEGLNGDYIKYTFSVKQTLVPPAKGVIKKVSAGKKKLTVKWGAVLRAKAYQIAIKKDGSKWKFYNVSSKKRKKTFTKLKSRKKYAVKIRGYFKTSGGAKKYGKWSAVKKVRVK